MLQPDPAIQPPHDDAERVETVLVRRGACNQRAYPRDQRYTAERRHFVDANQEIGNAAAGLIAALAQARDVRDQRVALLGVEQEIGHERVPYGEVAVERVRRRARLGGNSRKLGALSVAVLWLGPTMWHAKHQRMVRLPPAVECCAAAGNAISAKATWPERQENEGLMEVQHQQDHDHHPRAQDAFSTAAAASFRRRKGSVKGAS